jgi:hypothetical protein
VQVAARFSTNYYGGGTPLYQKSVRHMLEDVRGYLAEIIPQTIGLETQRWTAHKIPPELDCHWTILGLALGVLGAYLLFVLICWLAKRRRSLLGTLLLNDETLHFPVYLCLVALQSFAAFVVLSPPSDDIRYTYQLLFGFVGVYALQKRLGTDVRLWRLSLVFLFGALVCNVAANAQSWVDLSRIDQGRPVEHLIEYLKKNDIRALTSRDYWCSHNITFFSDEQIVGTPGRNGVSNVSQETAIFLQTPVQNRAEIDFAPCSGGVHVESWCIYPYGAAQKP